MSLQKIEINKIKIVENHRSTINEDHLDEMMQSIKQHGVLQPIGIAKDGHGGYVLRFGQRRLLACKKLGHKTIEAMVSDKVSDQKLSFEGLTENIQRKDPSFAEYGRIIEKLKNKEKLQLSEIAVRMGIPLKKINQIFQVYEELPEKLRSKVFFMEKGGGRKGRPGEIPATVATKIIAMKREHNLNNKDIDNIFDGVARKGMDSLDLDNVGSLVGSGMNATDALAHSAQYGVYTVDVVVKHTEMARLMQQHQLINRAHLFKKAIYGEIPPLPKPEFVFTGVKMTAKVIEKRDNKSFQKMRNTLIEMKKARLLSDNQVAALKSLDHILIKNLTDEQCQQIKDIHDSIKK